MKCFGYLLLVAIVYVIEAGTHTPTSERRPILVKYPPKEVIVGKTARLTCGVTTPYKARIQWYKNDTRITTHKGFTLTPNRTVGLQSTLTIDDVSTQNGSYHCVAKNEYGSTASHKILLQRACFSGLKVAGNEETTKAVGSFWQAEIAKIDSKPKAVFTWYRTSLDDHKSTQPIRNSWRSLTKEDGSLMISPIKQSDEGHYYCWAQNLVTRQKHCVAIITLKVTGYTEGGPLDLKYGPTPVPIPVGEETRMYAFFTYGKDITVTWKLGKKILGKYKDKSELIIKHTKKSDAGAYTVTATPVEPNGLPSSTVIVLQVKERPVIRNGPVNMTTTTQNLNVHCNATGIPRPQISWKVYRKEGKRQVLVKESANRILELASVNKPAGTILVLSCNASNDVGYQIAEAEINYTEQKITTPRTQGTSSEKRTDIRDPEHQQGAVNKAISQSYSHFMLLLSSVYILLLCHMRTT